MRISFTVNDCTVNVVRSQSKNDSALRAVWGMPVTSRGPKPRFTLDEVAAGAVAVADGEGLEAVSLSKLAAHLGMATTALYRYVESKEMIVDLMVDAAVGEPPRLIGSTWRDRAAFWAHGLAARYAEHAWLADVRVSGPPLYPHRLAWLDALLRELDEGSIPDPMQTALVLDGVVRTFAVTLASAGEGAGMPPEWLTEAVATRFPRFAQELTRNWADLDSAFDEAIDLVLRGAGR